jgi:hypothetical protein
MILQLSLLATTALLVIALVPTKRPGNHTSETTSRTGSRALLRGIVLTICPNCCEIIDGDGLATVVTMKTTTLIAGSPAAGDHVDVLAEFTGSRYLAVSIVKTRVY